MNEDKELESPSDGAAETATETTETPGKAAAPVADGESLRTALDAERKRRIEAERSYGEIRSAYNRRDQEVKTLRDQLRTASAGQGEAETETTDEDGLAEEVADTREQLAWLRFKDEHPHYAEYFDEMQKLAGDPRMRGLIESYRVVGNRIVLNTFATLHNAYNEVELRRVRKAQAQTTERKADSVVTTKLNKAQATISGDGAASSDAGSPSEDADFLRLLSDPNSEYNDIIKHPAFKRYADPNDPPRGI